MKQEDKQKAEEYAVKICEETPIDYNVVSDAYVAGAHSRDEEVEELKKTSDDFIIRWMPIPSVEGGEV